MIHLWVSIVLLGAITLQPGVSSAQGYPNRSVRVIVPASPGDSCDILTRLIGQKVAERLGQPFTADNRPGASGMLGLQLIAQAPPDRSTSGCGQGGNMVIVPLAYAKVPYDTFKDFAPIQLTVSNFLALVVHPSVPFRNVKDLVAYGRANPGKLAFATNGEGAFIHFSVELLRTKGGFTYLHVPYKSITSIVTEIMSGRIDATISSFISLYPHITAGRLKLLAIGRGERSPKYPDLPTIAETLPGYENGGYVRIIAQVCTPHQKRL